MTVFMCKINFLKSGEYVQQSSVIIFCQEDPIKVHYTARKVSSNSIKRQQMNNTTTSVREKHVSQKIALKVTKTHTRTRRH